MHSEDQDCSLSPTSYSQRKSEPWHTVSARIKSEQSSDSQQEVGDE